MSKVTDFYASFSDTEIAVCVNEALEWRKRAILPGGALRNMATHAAKEFGWDEVEALGQVDRLVIEEAARRFVQRVTHAERIADDSHKASADERAYATIEEYEELVGFKVSESFRTGWTMARTMNSHLAALVKPDTA